MQGIYSANKSLCLWPITAGRLLNMTTPQPYSDPSPDNAHFRVGDKERNHVLDLLSAHFADGYIDVHEFEERTGHAAIARTRGDLDTLLKDLPSGNSSAPAPNLDPELQERQSSPHKAVAKNSDRELEELINRGKKVQRLDSTIWTVAMILFFVFMFLTDWSYFWLFPVGAVGGSIAIRAFYKLDDDDEEIFNEINEKEQNERSKRLRKAAERRRELEQ